MHVKSGSILVTLALNAANYAGDKSMDSTVESRIADVREWSMIEVEFRNTSETGNDHYFPVMLYSNRSLLNPVGSDPP